MRPFLLVLATSVFACEPGFDTLQVFVDGTTAGFTCGGDFENYLSVDRGALNCLGYICASEYQPGSNECTSSTTNELLDTCVAQFFSCFRPSGACNADNQSWPDGHRIEVLEGSQSRGFFAPGAEEPCILEDDFGRELTTATLVRRR